MWPADIDLNHPPQIAPFIPQNEAGRGDVLVAKNVNAPLGVYHAGFVLLSFRKRAISGVRILPNAMER